MLLDPEIAIKKAEVIAVLSEHQRENLFFIPIFFLRLVISEDKDIFGNGMPVEISVEVDFSTL